jgi:hypothetical protein
MFKTRDKAIFLPPTAAQTFFSKDEQRSTATGDSVWTSHESTTISVITYSIAYSHRRNRQGRDDVHIYIYKSNIV